MPYDYEIKPALTKIIEERRRLDPSFNQRAVAKLAGLPEATVSRFSRQTRYDITTLFALADGLDVNIEDLFEVNRNKLPQNNQ